MNDQDQEYLNQLVDDGKLLANARHEPCALCGHVTEDGYWPVIRSGKAYCNRCWHSARNLIPNN